MILTQATRWSAAAALACTLWILAPDRAVPQVRSHAATQASVYALDVMRMVNEERSALGLPGLAADRRLFEASESHTDWMVVNNTFSHRGEGGSTPADRALAVGYAYTALGEALARGHTSPEQVVRGRACDRYCITVCDTDSRCDGWKQSPTHWRILMGSTYRDMGSAYLPGPSSRPHWWTVMVGNSNQPTEPLSGSSDWPTATATRTPAPTTVPTKAPTRTATPTSTSWLVPPTLAPTRTAYVTPTRIPSLTPEPTTVPPRAPTQTPSPAATATSAVGTSGVRGRVDVLGVGPRQGVAVFVDGTWRATTDAAGRFAAAGLGAGRHVVEARAPGMLPSRGAFDALPGITRDIGGTALVPGDVYPSGSIDLLDLFVQAAALGRCPGSPWYDAVLDLDGDGCVDDDDYLLVLGNIGRSGTTGWSTSP